MNASGGTLLFIYGTLKRACSNHRHLAGQTFLGSARTQPGFRLFEVGGYPGLVADPIETEGVNGEVWRVDAAGLQLLDAFEGVDEGLYHRERIPLQPPFDADQVEAYVYPHSVAGRREVGPTWRE